MANSIVKYEDEINKEHELCIQGMETSLQHAIRCGQLLEEQKARLDHGDFEPWVMEHCNFGKTQAWRYMTVAAKVPREELLIHEKNEQLPDLGGATSISEALRLITAANPKPPRQIEAPEHKTVPFSWEQHSRDMRDKVETIGNEIGFLVQSALESEEALYYLKEVCEFAGGVLRRTYKEMRYRPWIREIVTRTLEDILKDISEGG